MIVNIFDNSGGTVKGEKYNYVVDKYNDFDYLTIHSMTLCQTFNCFLCNSASSVWVWVRSSCLHVLPLPSKNPGWRTFMQNVASVIIPPSRISV